MPHAIALTLWDTEAWALGCCPVPCFIPPLRDPCRSSQGTPGYKTLYEANWTSLYDQLEPPRSVPVWEKSPGKRWLRYQDRGIFTILSWIHHWRTRTSLWGKRMEYHGKPGIWGREEYHQCSYACISSSTILLTSLIWIDEQPIFVWNVPLYSIPPEWKNLNAS